MSDFLLHGIKRKRVVNEESDEMNAKSELKALKNEAVGKSASVADSSCVVPVKDAMGNIKEVESSEKPKREGGHKKKKVRRERAFRRMRAKGIDVEEVSCLQIHPAHPTGS